MMDEISVMVTYIENLYGKITLNLMPINLEILVIQHFRRVVPRPAVLLFTGGGKLYY